MRVYHVGAMPPGGLGDTPRQPGMEAWLAMQHVNDDALAAEIVTPGAAFVQAAHGHGNRRLRPLYELNDQTLCTARCESQDDLKDAWTASGTHALEPGTRLSVSNAAGSKLSPRHFGDR